MPSTGAYINQAQLDGFNNVWTVGRDLSKFDGTVLTYYDYLNSSVPRNNPYYLDTRSISIDEDNTKWVGCAYIPTSPTPLIFNVQGPYAATGQSWSPLNIIGSTGIAVDAPTIYASPYGEEVLAFVASLNGGSGTGPAGIYGVTGGSLYVYNKILTTWVEPAENFVWPHIYDIKAKGILGSTYEYYLATTQGIYIIPPGTLKVSEYLGGQSYVEQANIWNSKNTSLPSDTIYSIDFDENGNLWIGTSSGLAYWDGSKIYVWDSTSLPGLSSDEITFVQSRPNGHVFFTAGDPEKEEGTGLYYFNGDTLTNYNTSNSSLPSDNIYSIMLVQNKSSNSGTVLYPNEIILVSGNNIGFFDYTIPHIYATSKYAGTTGWNFVNYTPTTEALPTDEAKLPKANKYSWTYPSWRNYQDSYLQYKHPGLDPRNLFLEANLKAIADGRAGEQNYWNLGRIPTFDSIQTAQSLQNASWVNGITGATAGTKITSGAYLDKKYIFGGYSINQEVYFGPKNNLEDLTITNPNPTYSSYQPWSGQSFGFVSWYNEAGQVQDVLTIRGLQTEVHDVQSSADEKSLYVLGTYKGYIEIGELIYSSTYPGAGGMTGPTGGPIGFSNIQTPGITGSPYTYSWIYNGTQTIPATGPFIPNTSVVNDTKESIFLLEIDKNLGSETSYGGINLGVTGALGSSYRVKDFRIFPGASSGYNPNSTSTSIDTVFYGPTLSLSVSDYSVEMVGTLKGGISTYKDNYGRDLDLPSTSDFIFSSWSSTGSSYFKGGFWISLGTELELLKTKVTSGTGGNVIFNSVQKDQGTLTYLITGTSDSYSFDFIGSSLTGGTIGSNSPFYLVSSYTPSLSSYNFIQTNSAPIDEYQGIDSAYFNGKYYWSTFYSGTGSFGSYSITEESDYNGYSILTAEITPSESLTEIFSNKVLPVDLNSTSLGMDDIEIGKESQRFYSFFSQGGTASNNIYKVNPSGGLNGSIYVGGTGHIRLSLDGEDNLLVGGYRIGSTGPTALPINTYSSDNSFTALIPQYIPGTGIDLGNIISRAGSGAWTWADVSNSEGDLLVPMLSTVFFSNYASQIFGKQNNKWILKDAKSDTVILDVKSVPYFIYTFTEAGYYTIQNSVEDSAGNVYLITKPAFIKVVNQSVATASDPNPEFVNSVDYGYPPVMPLEENASYRLSKSLLDQQAQILRDSRPQFGSGLVLPDDPNSTFSGN
jgi:hypothetical protein